MKCSKCNTEIADNAKFCPKCGAKVERIELIKKCPNCGEPLKDGAKFCAKCGFKVEKENKCPQCGTELKVGAKFCPVCGTKIVSDIQEIPISSAVCQQDVSIGTTSEPIAVSTSTKRRGLKKSDKIIIIAAIAVFVVIVITIIAVSLSSDSDSQSNYYSGNSYGYSSNSNLSKTYSNRFISFNYPSNYKITDEESGEDGEIVLNCEIKGDDLSIITITSGEEESLYFLDEQDINETCKEALRSINDELVSNIMYNNVKFRIMSKQKIGNCTGYISDFTANVYSYPIKGYTFVGVSGYYYVTIFTQAENDKYMSQLDDILSTLDVKAIALGIGDMPDDDM